MLLRKFEDLPDFMKIDEVKYYYDILDKKRFELFLKRTFDLIMSMILFIIFLIPMITIGIIIKLDSKGPVFYRQERVTQYGKHFKIHKFRTMVPNAEKIGTAVTVSNDNRITKTGRLLRRLKIDELPQVIDVIEGNMSFVGTRPEVVKYVKQYKPEYYATLLLPAGITSEASIRYKNEDKLLKDPAKADEAYIKQVLPKKMRKNLESIEKYGFLKEMKTIFKTILALAINSKEKEFI